MQEPNNKDRYKNNKTLSLHGLPSDLNVRKVWMNFILMKLTWSPELGHLFTLFYRGLVYKQGTICHRIFRNIETKRRCKRCCADYIGFYSNLAAQVWATVFITWSLLLSVKQIVDMYWVFMCFKHKSLQRPSVKDAGWQTCTIQS